MQCDQVAERLPEIVEGGHPADRLTVRHVESCLRCQAELVQYRRLLRTLRQLRTEVLAPAPGLVPEILAEIEALAERRAIRSVLTGRRAAYIGGLAVATAAAGAAGAAVIASRARHRHLRLAG